MSSAPKTFVAASATAAVAAAVAASANAIIPSNRKQPEVFSLLDSDDEGNAIAPSKQKQPEVFSLLDSDDEGIAMGTFPNIRTKSKLPTHLVDEMESLLTIALAEYLVRDIRPIDQVIKEIGRLLISVDLSKYEKIVRDDMNTLLDYAVGEIDYEESL
jgi:hypothetical protein